MVNFKVGDRVRRTQGDWLGMNTGDIGTITEILHDDTLHFNEFTGGHDEKNFELVWTPKNGEFVYVGCLDNKEKRMFLAMDAGRYVCKAYRWGHAYNSYDTVREIKPTRTITIDGKDIEISQESFDELKKQLTN